MRDVAGVILARLSRQPESYEREGRPELRDQLLGLAGAGAEAPRQVARQPGGVPVQCVTSWARVA